MAEINYNYRPKKICEKCKSEIPYLLSIESGKKFKCPVCGQIVDMLKCIVFPKEKISERCTKSS